MTAEAEVMVRGLDRPESVVWDPAGCIYAGNHTGEILRYSIETRELTQVADTGGIVLGLVLDGRGFLYWCDQTSKCVWKIDLASSARERVSGGTADWPMQTPNYLVFTDDGVLFVSDSGSWDTGGGRLFAIQHGTTSAVEKSESDAYPNGLAIDPAHDFLYMVESKLPGVVRFPLRSGGIVGSREVFWLAPLDSVPDGLAFTSAGDLVVAFFQPSQVVLVSNFGETTLAMDAHDATLAGPTNVAFFGDGLRRLVAANIRGTHLSEIPLEPALGVVGAAMRYPA
jgi:gluconolactonase